MSQRLSRRSLIATGAATLAIPAVARGAMRRTVRVATVNPPGSATGQACRAFADAVAKSPVLSGALQVDVVAGGAAGGELEMTQACINGTLELAVTASNVIGGIVPEIGLLDAAFLFRDAAHARGVLDSAIGEELTALVKPKGVNNLAWAENGLRHITANRPIRAPADLQGLHIRVPQSPVMVQAFKALGANAEPLPFPQLFDALRTGKFEAEENPVVTILTAHFNQVQKCLSLTGHVYSAAMVIAASDFLEDLEPPQRAALMQAAKAAAKASRDTASNGEQEGIGQLRAAGMTIVTDVDRTALAAAARPALDAIAQKLGPDRAARIRDFHA
ncbi:MAG TPA: TRAP transporter substrate-binding protein [Acetobacteraceae bacterium]|nr:TRAP transporter substrate-binding protein [Acetobacteraceae bacterium]